MNDASNQLKTVTGLKVRTAKKSRYQIYLGARTGAFTPSSLSDFAD